jgi:hypothetical protein
VRKAYFVITVLLLIAVVAQFYFAALGVFGPEGEDDELFIFHRIFGSMVLPALSVLAVVFAALSRAGARTVLLAALPIVLIGVQYLLVRPRRCARRMGGRAPHRRRRRHPGPSRRERAGDHGHSDHAHDARAARAFDKDARAARDHRLTRSCRVGRSALRACDPAEQAVEEACRVLGAQ